MLTLAVLLLSGSAIADNPDAPNPTTKRKKFVGLTYQAGKVLPSNAFVKGENSNNKPIDYYQSGRAELGWQTDGRQLWEKLYNLPYYGIGYYHVDFFNENELGSPSALYGFLGGPIKRWNKLSWDFLFGFGLTYNWKSYDVDINPFNYAIGSNKTVYIDAGMTLNYPIGKRWDALWGMSFTHFSNGATTLPNLGINMMATKLGVKYNLQPERAEVKEWDIPEYQKESEFYVFLAMSSKQVSLDTTNTGLKDKYYDVNYAMATVSVGRQWQISHKVKFGAGADLNYDGTMDAQYDIQDGEVNQITHSFGEKLGVGVFASFEWVIGRLSVIAQPGYHVLRKEFEGQTPASYQRAGIKYHLWDDIFAGVNIRAYDFGVADYIEWTLGYRMKW